MSLPVVRGRAFRLALRFPYVHATPTRCAQAPLSCRPRCISTLSPPSIAALLRQSQPQSSAQQPSSSGETLTLHGFVRSVRKQKRIAFAAIGDGSSLQTVQAVLTPSQADG